MYVSKREKLVGRILDWVIERYGVPAWKRVRVREPLFLPWFGVVLCLGLVGFGVCFCVLMGWDGREWGVDARMGAGYECI